MGDGAIAIKVMILDAEIGPLIDIALSTVERAEQGDIAQIEIRAGFQRAEDPRCASATALQKSGR